MKTKLTVCLTALIIICFLFIPKTIVYGVDRNEKIIRGDRDKYVLEMQEALYNQGFLKIHPTGYFGTDTEAAVLEFQKKNNLTVDGKAGPETRKKLLGSKYKPITEKRDVSEETAPNKDGTEKLIPGDTGPAIESLQKRLQALGYYTYGKITGFFGPSTQVAVERFQRAHNLKMDGVVGENTLYKLNSKDAKNYTMYPGDRGDDIKQMQKKLIALGYYKGSATGYFGTVTEEALKYFQKINKLSADGKAGKNTIAKLYSGDALKNTGKVATSGTGSAKKVSTIDKMINYGKGFQGKKYVLGGNGPNVFDCSGYVRYVLKHVGINLPRTSYDQSKVSKYKTIDSIGELKKGDLMFFKTSSKEIGHAGIYLGGNKFIHCAPGVGVKIETLVKGRYYYDRFRWGKRVF